MPSITPPAKNSIYTVLLIIVIAAAIIIGTYHFHIYICLNATSDNPEPTYGVL